MTAEESYKKMIKNVGFSEFAKQASRDVLSRDLERVAHGRQTIEDLVLSVQPGIKTNEKPTESLLRFIPDLAGESLERAKTILQDDGNNIINYIGETQSEKLQKNYLSLKPYETKNSEFDKIFPLHNANYNIRTALEETLKEDKFDVITTQKFIGKTAKSVAEETEHYLTKSMNFSQERSKRLATLVLETYSQSVGGEAIQMAQFAINRSTDVINKYLPENKRADYAAAILKIGSQKSPEEAVRNIYKIAG